MSYKPKFCCECGEKIERVDWKPWTSRRFCSLCETEYGTGEKFQAGFAVAGIFIGIVGLSSFWLRNEKPSNAGMSNLITAASSHKNKIEANQTLASQTNAGNGFVQPSTQAQTTNSAIETPARTQALTTQNSKLSQAQLQQKVSSPAAAVYFCGAQTKKGSACLRRVKGGGRCWQHAGQAAMLPQKELVADNN
jgi:hypothetical protein